MTREEFAKLKTDEERMEFLGSEIDKRQKRLMSEGIYPHSMSWILGKTLILNQIGSEYGVNFNIQNDPNDPDSRMDKIRCSIVDAILKSGLVKTMNTVIILNKFIKLPRFVFPRWVYEMDGLKIQQDDGDIEMRPILKDYTLLKIWEPNTTQIVKDNVKLGDVCLDIGASIGYFTMQFARLVGQMGHVYSFEPTEMNYCYLCENIHLNGFQDICSPFKVAAWDKYEVLKFPRCAAKPFWSNGIPVAEFLANLGVKKVDFIKIDVDGSEPNVLKGLIPIFENNPQLKMVIEYYPKYIKDAGLSPEEFMEILNKYFDYKEIPDDYSHGCWNFFCTRKK